MGRLNRAARLAKLQRDLRNVTNELSDSLDRSVEQMMVQAMHLVYLAIHRAKLYGPVKKGKRPF